MLCVKFGICRIMGVVKKQKSHNSIFFDKSDWTLNIDRVIIEYNYVKMVEIYGSCSGDSIYPPKAVEISTFYRFNEVTNKIKNLKERRKKKWILKK